MSTYPNAKVIPMPHRNDAPPREGAPERLPYIPFYPTEFLSGVAELSAAERGVYITLLAMIYDRAAPVDVPEAALARRCGCSVAVLRRCLATLRALGKIIDRPSGMSNVRAENEILKREAVRAKRSKSGSQGWEKRKQNQQGSDDLASPDHSVCFGDEESDSEDENKRDSDESLSSLPGLSAPQRPDEVQRAVDAYNAVASDVGWPRAQKLTTQRRAALRQRLRDAGGIEGWRHALERARASPHLCGQNDRGWTCNFDFLVRESSFTKLMEGAYDPRTGKPAARPQGDRGLFDAAARSVARRQAQPRDD